MDRHTKEQRAKNMRAIKAKNTEIELVLRRMLFSKGLRYRIHYSDVPGKPDIVFPSKKLAVFCDSEFWHGYRWGDNSRKILTNRQYWIPKIERNMQRDRQINRALKAQGWAVLRFWGREILASPEDCAVKVLKALGF